MTTTSLLQRVRQIWDSAQSSAVRSVNSAHVCAVWLIGREIVDSEQQGKRRAAYGQQILKSLSEKLSAEYGSGFSLSSLRAMRSFFIAYPDLLAIRQPVAGELTAAKKAARTRGKPQPLAAVLPTVSGGEWKPGQLHGTLSWRHYQMLVKVERRDARDFYEIESVQSGWSARELERQVASLFFERHLKSRDKRGLLALTREGVKPQRPLDVIKEPYVLEFLGIPETHRLLESDLEETLIGNLQKFLLELGKGFAFVSRQERLTLDGDHFYTDLVFYHTILKCYVVIDLKVGKLTHADLGQMQLYVNYFDRERRTQGDNPTLGLILCTIKNEAMVKYTLGTDQEQKIFASRYRLHLPSEAELKEKLRREVSELAPPAPPAPSKRGKKS